LTASADIYSLAKSFYTTVCGRPPSQFICDPITYLPTNSISESARGRLLEVLRRATDDNPAARYASVIEFWSDLAQVAPAGDGAKAEEKLGDEDDATIIRPRLNVAPGALPRGPERPTFDPALAATRIQVSLKNATLVETPRSAQPPASQLPVEDSAFRPAQKSKQTDHTSKFFIELQESPKETPKESPKVDAFQTQLLVEPPAARNDSKAPAKVESPSPAKPSIVKKTKKAVDKFNWKVRRNVFIGLLAITFFGAIVSLFNYVKSQPAPFGFGPPTEIEIITQELNVRSAPSAREREKVLGSVRRGTRHEVLELMKSGWLRIRVREWATKEPGVNTDTGWIYGDLDGNLPNVRVVSRKFWR
jgi:hypothetical protein